METLVVGLLFNWELLFEGSIGARDRSMIHVHDEVPLVYSELRWGGEVWNRILPVFKITSSSLVVTYWNLILGGMAWHEIVCAEIKEPFRLHVDAICYRYIGLTSSGHNFQSKSRIEMEFMSLKIPRQARCDHGIKFYFCKCWKRRIFGESIFITNFWGWVNS